jgi:hypothetical protein
MSDGEHIPELERIVLTEDLLEHGLKCGDVGTIVHADEGGRGYIVEFMTLSGDTAAVVPVMPTQVRRVDRSEITHARRMAG